MPVALDWEGDNAPGGAYDYVINGNMIAGFAIVAWPARYGVSGIMTFVASNQGDVLQKDLGETVRHLGDTFRPFLLGGGTILALTGVGATLVFGIQRIANFAHGEYLTFAAYLGLILNTLFDQGIVVATLGARW